MKKRLTTLLAIFVTITMTLGLLVACNGGGDPATEATNGDTEAAADAGERPIIGVAMDNIDEPYWDTALNGIKYMADKLGYELDIQVAQFDATMQNRQIDDFIARGVGAIICAPHDSNAILSAVRAANEAGIPFIYLDRRINDEDGAVLDWGAETDNVALAEQSMQFLADYARENGIQINLLELVGYLGDQNSMFRSEGVQNAIDNNSDVLSMTLQVPTEGDIERTMTGTVNALQAHPEINAVFMVSDFFLEAILSGMKQAERYVPYGEDGHIYVISFGGSALSITEIRDGFVFACAAMNPFGTGSLVVEAAVAFIEGRDPGPVAFDPGFILHRGNFDEMWEFAFDASSVE